MKESVGNPKGYKSAFLLFYISKHIVDQMQKIKIPVYSKEYSKLIPIPAQIHEQINVNNKKFEDELKYFEFNQIATKIINVTKDRVAKLDQQEHNMDQVVSIKLFSFVQFLRVVEFKGYAKWIILNRATIENHPKKLGLIEIQE